MVKLVTDLKEAIVKQNTITENNQAKLVEIKEEQQDHRKNFISRKGTAQLSTKYTPPKTISWTHPTKVQAHLASPLESLTFLSYRTTRIVRANANGQVLMSKAINSAEVDWARPKLVLQ